MPTLVIEALQKVGAATVGQSNVRHEKVKLVITRNLQRLRDTRRSAHNIPAPGQKPLQRRQGVEMVLYH